MLGLDIAIRNARHGACPYHLESTRVKAKDAVDGNMQHNRCSNEGSTGVRLLRYCLGACSIPPGSTRSLAQLMLPVKLPISQAHLRELDFCCQNPEAQQIAGVGIVGRRDASKGP